MVSLLHLLRQRKEGPSFILRLGDQVRRNAVVGDHRKAEPLERAADGGGKALRIGCGAGERYGSD